MEQSEFDEFISDITPDVMAVLGREGFFCKLEESIFPSGTIKPNRCDNSYSVSTRLLSAAGHDEDAQEDVFDVMRANGGFCDCEILLNAAPESKARENYWREKAHRLVRNL